ncbi:iron ABC transporter permease [Nesterenkonia halotolerans]|uniref:Iron complex transport system permease protein n=1 Tax=Nesterenkonia halotolerans TaxID=225325 RepID=A0ABR9J9B0_9MICC|nr:iron ABC transporter permease [Nesterenkonia halotolerans]MBE1515585.1 iron complex transport system permease protein [Nesterenkonia halotolerans]
MTELKTAARAASTVAGAEPQGGPLRARAVATGALVLGGALLLVLSAVHLTQGTSAASPLDLLAALFSSDDGAAASQLRALALDSRLPRLVGGLVVGAALGIAGCALQAMTRNPLASPDTLAVNAGAHLALTAAAAFGISMPLLSSAALAFLGGGVAAGVVLLLAGFSEHAPIRLVLAGTVVAMGLASVTAALLMLYAQSTQGLFLWGAGTLNLAGLSGLLPLLPVVIAATIGLVLLTRSTDVLSLGADTAQSMGVNVGFLRGALLVCAVALSAAAVTMVGPLGFVGLCAPAIVRLAATKVTRMGRFAWALGASALVGALIVIGADVAVRALVFAVAGPNLAVAIPTGVVTSLVGAVFLVVLALRMRSAGGNQEISAMPLPHGITLTRRVSLTIAAAVLLLVLIGVGMLLGDWWLRIGDISLWFSGEAARAIEITLDFRSPRVAAAVLAGAVLAIAGALVQTVTRNPLADPGILGVAAAGGAGAVVALILFSTSAWTMSAGATVGAILAGAVVFLLAGSRGSSPEKVVLVGIGVMTAALAITQLLISSTNPYNQAMAISFLGGSTFGTTWGDLTPILLTLLLSVPVLIYLRRELDLISIDELTPRILGVRLAGVRATALIIAVLLSAVAVVGVGVISFVGLAAPHMARMLVGREHKWFLPVAALLGAVLVSVSDTFGRTVIAPDQLPAGLVVAVLGPPYLLWLLRRSTRS